MSSGTNQKTRTGRISDLVTALLRETEGYSPSEIRSALDMTKVMFTRESRAPNVPIGTIPALLGLSSKRDATTNVGAVVRQTQAPPRQRAAYKQTSGWKALENLHTAAIAAVKSSNGSVAAIAALRSIEADMKNYRSSMGLAAARSPTPSISSTSSSLGLQSGPERKEISRE